MPSTGSGSEREESLEFQSFIGRFSQAADTEEKRPLTIQESPQTIDTCLERGGVDKPVKVGPLKQLESKRAAIEVSLPQDIKPTPVRDIAALGLGMSEYAGTDIVSSGAEKVGSAKPHTEEKQPFNNRSDSRVRSKKANQQVLGVERAVQVQEESAPFRKNYKSPPDPQLPKLTPKAHSNDDNNDAIESAEEFMKELVGMHSPKQRSGIVHIGTPVKPASPDSDRSPSPSRLGPDGFLKLLTKRPDGNSPLKARAQARKEMETKRSRRTLKSYRPFKVNSSEIKLCCHCPLQSPALYSIHIWCSNRGLHLTKWQFSADILGRIPCFTYHMHDSTLWQCG